MQVLLTVIGVRWYAVLDMMPKDVQIAIRVEQDVLDRADKIVEALGKAGGLGLAPTRTAVLRSALLRGLMEMEAEHIKRKR